MYTVIQEEYFPDEEDNKTIDELDNLVQKKMCESLKNTISFFEKNIKDYQDYITMQETIFENTYYDLNYCLNHWNDKLSNDEFIYRQRILRIAKEIVNNF